MLLRDQFWVPANEEVVAVKVRTTDLGCDWNFSFFGENNTVDVVFKQIVIAPSLKPCLQLFLRYALHLPDVCGMQARIPCDDYISLHMLIYWLQGDIIDNLAVKFSLLQDVPLINNLNKGTITPIILADLSIKMLLLTFN